MKTEKNIQKLPIQKEYDKRKLAEYLRFLLHQIHYYKQDWEVTLDELQIFKNELVLFQDRVNQSVLIPEEIKRQISHLTPPVIHIHRGFFKTFLFRRRAGDRITDEQKGYMEQIEHDINKILTEILLME